jgi:hypothetical protein
MLLYFLKYGCIWNIPYFATGVDDIADGISRIILSEYSTAGGSLNTRQECL